MAKIKRYGSDQPLPVLGQLTCARGQYDRENADLELRPAYMGEGITRDGIGPRNFSDSYRDEQPYANFAIHAYVRTQVRYESDQLWEAWGFSYAYRSPYGELAQASY